MTADEFLVCNDGQYSELVRGVRCFNEPPRFLHGWLATRLSSRLSAHVEEHDLGVVLSETGYVVEQAPDTVRGPDVSFVSYERLPDGELPEKYFRGAPDLAVEILSPSDRPGTLKEKIAEYLAAGARLVWVVDPYYQRVTVHRPDQSSIVLTKHDVLDGEDVLPGFRYELAQLFWGTSLPVRVIR